MLININQKKNLNLNLFSISYRALKKPVRVVSVSGGCVWFDIMFHFCVNMVYNNKLHSHKYMHIKYSAFMNDVMRIHVKQI